MGVAYKVVDIAGPGWVETIEKSNCDGFLIWPSVHLTIWKQMLDERLAVMTRQLNKLIYPSYEEMWLCESKRRMHYWLAANAIPHPRTWVYYDHEEALAFATRAPLPIVVKTDCGSGASGVRVLRSRRRLLRVVSKCFTKGIVRRGGYPLDRQWGNILFQEYLPEVKEWRVIRLGNSYFGHQKGKVGDFHSGTDIVIFEDPPTTLLDFVRAVTSTGRFSSMDLDVFETSDGRYLVNELQTVFGPDPEQMRVGDKPGRYLKAQPHPGCGARLSAFLS